MKKILFAAALAISAIIVSSSCENPPIFAAIEQEVKLNPASVKGFVHGIVKIGDLYASNGKIYYKTEGSRGKWSEMSGCPAGLCTGLATDGSSLYASFGNGNAFKAYKYNAPSWVALPGAAASAQYVVGTKSVFAFEKNNSGYTFYTIESGSVSHTWTNTKIPSGAAETYCLFEDCLHKNDGSKIASSPSSGLKGICEGPTSNSVFVFNDSTLYCYNGNTSTWTNIVHGVSSPQSITYLSTKKLVLISGKNGYREIKLASASLTNLANAKPVSAGSSDSSIPWENYHQYQNSVGKYTINPIKAFDYGTNGYIIYTGVLDHTAKYTGLWGFYYPDRIEWNRE